MSEPGPWRSVALQSVPTHKDTLYESKLGNRRAVLTLKQGLYWQSGGLENTPVIVTLPRAPGTSPMN